MKKLLLVLLIGAIVTGSIFAAGAKEAKADQFTIAGIIFQEDQFMRIVHIGMRDAAKERGVELLEANSLNRVDREIEIVNNYITRGVDAIAITPLSSTASIAALKQAHDKGIKVVTFNSPIDATFPVSYINSSQNELGESTGKEARKYIQENLAGKAKIKVATLGFKALLPEISDARVNSFLNQIKDLPGVEIVAQQDAWLTEDAIKRAGDIMTAHSDIDIIYGANDGGTVGSVLAVRNAGKAGQVAVFGIDASEQIADFLLSNDGILQAVTGQQPYQIGYMSIDFAYRSLKGDKVDDTVIVPGLMLSRNNPAGINQFKTDLKRFTD